MDNRLKYIAGLVPNGSTVADIGTDHAYLPIYLVKNNICNKVIATDIRKKPLLSAKQNVEKSGLDNISLRLGNGLEPLIPNEANVIIIAGMGGEVIWGIINAAEWLKSSNIKLILQPMSHSEDLRKFLAQNGFNIKKETAVLSENRIYTVMQVVFTGEICDYSKLYYYVGKLPCNLGVNEINYIKWRRKVLFECAQKISAVEKKQAEYKELTEAVKLIDTLLLENEKQCH